jgi:glycosyltransferase involved in cell wall biosynthesis
MNAFCVSVIIPTFNSGAVVTQAIESVFAQTLPALEVIVVDDGSNDDTRRRLAMYEGRVRYLFQENKGVAAARNLGLREAKGELIAFLDADDVWHPRKLELQTAAMSDLAMIGTRLFDWPGEFPDPKQGSIQRVAWDELAVRNYFVTSSVILRRDILARVGTFDTNLHGPEDYDLWLRIAEVAPVGNLMLPLTGYRTTPGSLSQQGGMMRAGLRRILRKLDQRNAWRGRWLLRRKAYSYCNFACAYMDGAAGRPARGLAQLAESLFWYPLPYRRREVRFSLARLRMWPMMILRLLGLRAPVRA